LTKKEQKEITGSDKEIVNEDKMIKIYSTNIENFKWEIKSPREKLDARLYQYAYVHNRDGIAWVNR